MRLSIRGAGFTIVTAAVLAAAILLWPSHAPSLERSLGQSQFEAATLSLIDPPPDPKYSRTIWASTELDAIEPALDRCRGPVSANLGPDNPVLVAEHDYCGGSDWMWHLDESDAVKLDGKGVDDGVYVVTGLSRLPRNAGAAVSDLPSGDVVLQTCVSKTEMVFVALAKYEVIG